MENKIKEILKNEINPLLAEHFGGAELVEIKDNVVYVKMLGACGGCPSSQDTIENIIQVKLQAQIPEIERVSLYQGVSEELINFAKDILNRKK